DWSGGGESLRSEVCYIAALGITKDRGYANFIILTHPLVISCGGPTGNNRNIYARLMIYKRHL
ncbi:MAG: hypothetical protein IK122_00745, partial [Alphaproteobacteria bacterium]|nr:hypothetical protein [Alphaproteobacteria bacterium]